MGELCLQKRSGADYHGNHRTKLTQMIGLIELGLGLRSNNARRTVFAWPVFILISLFFRCVYATLHLALLLDPFVGIFEVIRAFGHDHDGQRLQKHIKD